MPNHVCGADKAEEEKPKRSPRNEPSECLVANYGLTKNQMLLNFADHLYKQTYKIYKGEKTEWLIFDFEVIGVQKKHKRDLGIVLEKFFEPCYYGAPKPQPHLPVVKSLQLQKLNNLDSKSSDYVSAQPWQGRRKRNNLVSLLSSDQVQLIDRQELMWRVMTVIPQRVSLNNRVEKDKKLTTRTIIGKRKPSALEVLRASNRPKRALTSRKKHSSSLGAINHKQDSRMLPAIEDSPRFSASSNCSTPQLDQKRKLEKKRVGNAVNTRKMWKYALKVRRSESYLLKKIDMNANEASPKPNMSKNALNIRLYNTNKKIPVGNAKKTLEPHKVRISRAEIPAENKAKEQKQNRVRGPRIGNARREEHNEIGRQTNQVNVEKKTYEGLHSEWESNYSEDFLYDSEIEDFLEERPEELGKEKAICGNDDGAQAGEGWHYLEDFPYDSDIENLMEERPEEYAEQLQEASNVELNQESSVVIEEIETHSERNSDETLVEIHPVEEHREYWVDITFEFFIEQTMLSRRSFLNSSRNVQFFVVRDPPKAQYAIIQPGPMLYIRSEFDLSRRDSWVSFHSVDQIESLLRPPCDAILRIFICFHVVILVSCLVFNTKWFGT